MSDLIEHPGTPRNYTIPGRTIADDLDRLRAALIEAMEIVQEDRLVLYRTALDPRTETVTDPYSLAGLADYDRVIAQADAALGSGR